MSVRSVVGVSSIMGLSGWLFTRSGDQLDDEVYRKTEASINVLPDLYTADRTKVIRIPQLLNEKEIDLLLQSIERVRARCGKTGRDASGTQLLSNAPWQTVYLHTNHAYKYDSCLKETVDKIVHAALGAACSSGYKNTSHSKSSKTHTSCEELSELNKVENGSLLSFAPLVSPESLQMRCVEYHQVKEEGGLPDMNHFDGGSVLTIDVMLADPHSDFDGGNFCTLNFDHSNDIKKGNLERSSENENNIVANAAEPAGTVEKHLFEKGDVSVFLSHKKHFVQPVTRGTRQVMVIELWQGEARTCAHRCDKHWGACWHNRLFNIIERLVMSSHVES